MVTILLSSKLIWAVCVIFHGQDWMAVAVTYFRNVPKRIVLRVALSQSEHVSVRSSSWPWKHTQSAGLTVTATAYFPIFFWRVCMYDGRFSEIIVRQHRRIRENFLQFLKRYAVNLRVPIEIVSSLHCVKCPCSFLKLYVTLINSFLHYITLPQRVQYNTIQWEICKATLYEPFRSAVQQQ